MERIVQNVHDSAENAQVMVQKCVEKLRDTEIQRSEEEKGRKEAEKWLKDAELQKIRLKKKLKELYIDKKTLEEDLMWSAYIREPAMRLKLSEADVQKKEEVAQMEEKRYCLIGSIALCSTPLLLYMALKSGLLRKFSTSLQ